MKNLESDIFSPASRLLTLLFAQQRQPSKPMLLRKMTSRQLLTSSLQWLLTRNLNRGEIKGSLLSKPRTSVERSGQIQRLVLKFGFIGDEWSKLSKDEQDEVREIRQEEIKQQVTKRKATDNCKIVAFESMLEEQANKIVALSSTKSDIKLPPTPKGNPLKTTPSFSQRGEWLQPLEVTTSECFGRYLSRRCLEQRISGVQYNINPSKIMATELGLHADSLVVGRYSRILEDTGRKATVSGITTDLGKPTTLPVVNAAVAYECDVTGRSTF